MQVTWDQAKSLCQQAGLTLLVIQTELKQGRFEAYLAGTDEIGDWTAGGAWIAGTDRQRETGGLERFYWSPYGNEKTEMLYENFGDRTPRNGCVVISNAKNSAFGTWWVKDCNCNNNYKTVYFCESRF